MQKPPPLPRVHLPPPLGGQGAVAGGGTPTFANYTGGKGGGAGAPVREAPRGGSVPPCVKDCPGHGGSPRRERSPPPLLRGGEKNTRRAAGWAERAKKEHARGARSPPFVSFSDTAAPRAAGLATPTNTIRPASMDPPSTSPPDEAEPASPASPPPPPSHAARTLPSRSALSPVASLFSAMRLGGRRRGEGGTGSGMASLPRPGGGWVDGGRAGGREGEREGRRGTANGGRAGGWLPRARGGPCHREAAPCTHPACPEAATIRALDPESGLPRWAPRRAPRVRALARACSKTRAPSLPRFAPSQK